MNTTTCEPASGSDDALWQQTLAQARAFMAARALLTATSLDLFTVLDERGPLSAGELAKHLSLSPRGVDALARTLCPLGILRFDTKSKRYYCPKPLLERLSRKRSGWRGAPLFELANRWRDWTRLDEVVRSAKPIERPRERRERIAEQLAMHQAAIDQAEAWADALSAVHDLDAVEHMVDLGSGPGTFSAALLKRASNLRATLYDVQLAHDVARRLLPKAWIESERVRFRSGDMRLDLIPAGANLYLLSDVLAGFDDVEVRRVLVRVRDALTPGGLLLVREYALRNDLTGPLAAALHGLDLLLRTCGGGTRTINDWKTLLSTAGFRLTNTLQPTSDPDATTFLATPK